MMRITALIIPLCPNRNIPRRSIVLLMTMTLLDHLLPSLPAHLLTMRLLLCTRLLAVLHPLSSAAPPPQPLTSLVGGLSLVGLMVIVLIWRMMTFKLQEVRANQARDRDPM